LAESAESLILGGLTGEECESLKQISDRRTALAGLIRSLADRPGNLTDDLYARLVADATQAEGQMREWWSATCRGHGWDPGQGYGWGVDFNSRQVWLLPQPGATNARPHKSPSAR
jgi:CXXX repeat modification system protein